jgi:hypothetical protein
MCGYNCQRQCPASETKQCSSYEYEHPAAAAAVAHLCEQLDVGRLPAALTGAADLQQRLLELTATHTGSLEQVAPAHAL